jgi:hypothetical protein
MEERRQEKRRTEGGKGGKKGGREDRGRTGEGRIGEREEGEKVKWRGEKERGRGRRGGRGGGPGSTLPTSSFEGHFARRLKAPSIGQKVFYDDSKAPPSKTKSSSESDLLLAFQFDNLSKTVSEALPQKKKTAFGIRDIFAWRPKASPNYL